MVLSGSGAGSTAGELEAAYIARMSEGYGAQK